MGSTTPQWSEAERGVVQTAASNAKNRFEVDSSKLVLKEAITTQFYSYFDVFSLTNSNTFVPHI
jgi:hypothetical protein